MKHGELNGIDVRGGNGAEGKWWRSKSRAFSREGKGFRQSKRVPGRGGGGGVSQGAVSEQGIIEAERRKGGRSNHQKDSLSHITTESRSGVSMSCHQPLYIAGKALKIVI